MKEELTAGGKEFFFAMLWAAGLYIVSGILMSAFKNYIGAAAAIVIFCIFGFFVLTHYASRFTYTLKNGRLRINRMIGKRNKEIELACADISDMYYGFKPQSFPRRPYNMRKSIISGKRSLYIVYKDGSGGLCGVIIEPSDKLRKRIEKERNKKQVK